MASDMRSDQQRKALEVYCRELGDALNDAGFDMKAVFAVKTIDVPWSQSLIKEALWKSVQAPMFPETVNEKGEVSTTKLEKSEVDQVYEVLNRHIASNFGVHVPFPSRDLQDES